MGIESVVDGIYRKKMRADEFKGSFSEAEFEKFLAEQRGIIDNCNEVILDEFAKRVEATKRVAIAKFIAETPVYASNREEEILKKAEDYSRTIGVDPLVGREIILLILKKAREIQDSYHSSL